MNRATFPEMLQCVNPTGAYCPNMTVLERQRACLKWQHQQQGIYDDFYVSGLSGEGAFGMTSHGLIVANNNPVKFDPGVHNEWPDFGGNCGLNSEMGVLETNYGMTPKASLGPVAMTGMSTPHEKVKEGVVADQKSGQVGRESLRKRKVDKLSTIIKSEEEEEEKKIKGLWTEETESKLTFLSNNDNKKKKSEVQKQDYIHVRARRGQATDSHSLAERVRREQISERMKFLQDLVPGCNKITGKAGMLDEIINYVQSLQRQVEFLSMKLAAVNPSLDLDIIDSHSAKEISPACTPNFATIEAGSSELTNQGYHLHFNPASQVVESCVGMELGVNPDPGLWRRISAPMAVTQQQQQQQMQAQSATTWDDISLQNLYNIEFQQ